MRIRQPILAALLVVCTVAVAHLPINAGDTRPEDELTVAVYPVADLPVYTIPRAVESRFQPALLVSLLKAELGSDHWQGERDSIARHERTLSLVIRTTRSNHKRISTILESLRRELRPVDAREETESRLDDNLDTSRSQAVPRELDQRIEEDDLLRIPGKDQTLPTTDERHSSLSQPEPEASRLFVDLGTVANRLNLTSQPFQWPTMSELQEQKQETRLFQFGGVTFTR